MSLNFNNLPDPYTTSFLRWAAELTMQNAIVPQIGLRSGIWKEWATQVVSLLGLDGQVLPDPTRYDDWRQWAAEFKKAVGA